MAGNKGTGKTHVAVAIYLEAAQKGIRVKFVSCPEMLAGLRRGLDTGSFDNDLEDYQNVELLILDDLGTEYTKARGRSWGDEQLYRILNSRYMNGENTVITTNVSVADLDPRIADRLLDTQTGFSQVAVFNCPSYRSGRTW